MGMFEKSVEEIWRGGERVPRLPRYALRGIVSQPLPAGLRCGAPLALENASEVPVLLAEEQISDFARDDNATDAERRGIQGIETGAKTLLRSLHFAPTKGAGAPVRMTIFIWGSGPPRKAVPTEAKKNPEPL